MSEKNKHGVVAQVVSALLGVTSAMFGVVPTPPPNRPSSSEEGHELRFFPKEVEEIIRSNEASYRTRNNY
jgi:hypothetical protein